MPKENEALQKRHAYQKVFCQTPGGQSVLADILNMLGFFSVDPALISPEQTAICNRILQNCGINIYENIGNYIRSIVDAATDIDVVQEVKHEN